MYTGTVLYTVHCTPVQASLDTLLSTRVISVYTATVTEHSHPCLSLVSWPHIALWLADTSHWHQSQSGPQLLTPQHCPVNTTSPPYSSQQQQQRWRENYADMTWVRTLWSVTWECDIICDGGGAGAGQRIKFPQTFSENFLDVRPSVTLWDDNVRSHYTRCYGFFSPRYRSLSPNMRHPSLHLPRQIVNSTVDIRSWDL